VKILIVQDHRLTGGAAKAAWRLGWALQQMDHHMIHVCGDEGSPEPREAIHLTGKPRKSLARCLEALRPDPQARRQRVLEAWRKILEREKPDRIWFHNLAGARKWGWSEELVSLALERHSCLWTLHDMWALGAGRDYFPEEELDSEFLKSPLRRIFSGPHADRLMVTAPSQWLAGLASRATGKKALLLPNPLDSRIFRPYPQVEARALWGFQPHQRISLAVAENLADRRKGMGFLLEAWARARRDDRDLLCLVGRPPADLPPIPGLRFLGTVASPSELAMLYSAADLFVHGAEIDNAPCVIQESLACGCPVLARPVGGIPEMIQIGKHGKLADVSNFWKIWREWEFGVRTESGAGPTASGLAAWEKKMELVPGFGPRPIPASFHLEAPQPPVGVPNLDLRLGGEDNLFHWLIFHLGQILVLQKEGRPFSDIYLPGKEREFQRLSLQALGIPSSRLQKVSRGNPTPVSWKVVVGPKLGADLDWFYQTLRERLMSCAEGVGVGPRIYISRRDAQKRRINNEAELSKRLESVGFVKLCPGELPWPQQIAAFAHAEWIVGPHGGAFTNILFSPPGATLVELFPAEEDLWFFKQIAESLGVRHDVWQARPNIRLSKNHSGFEVSPQALMLYLRSLGLN